MVHSQRVAGRVAAAVHTVQGLPGWLELMASGAVVAVVAVPAITVLQAVLAVLADRGH